MYQSDNEEGETRMGCFSDTSDDSRMALDKPTCPYCGSNDYELLPQTQNNCVCSNCEKRYTYYFNR